MEEKSAAVMLAEMERERDELTSAINLFRRRMGLSATDPQSNVAVNGRPTSDTTGITGAPSDAGPLQITRDMFFGMNLPEAIRSYLSMVKRPTKASTIVKALADGGFQSTSSNFDTRVRQTLSSRMPDIVNLPNGWALAAWYPGRNFEKRAVRPKVSPSSTPATEQKAKRGRPRKSRGVEGRNEPPGE